MKRLPSLLLVVTVTSFLCGPVLADVPPVPKPPHAKPLPTQALLVITPGDAGQPARLTLPANLLAQKIDRKSHTSTWTPTRTVMAGLAMSAAIVLLGFGWVGRSRRVTMSIVAGLIGGAAAGSAWADRAVPPGPHAADVDAKGEITSTVTLEIAGDGNTIHLTIDRAALTAALAAGTVPAPGHPQGPGPSPSKTSDSVPAPDPVLRTK